MKFNNPDDHQAADYLDAVAGIRKGLADVDKGLYRDFEEVFDDLEREA